LAALKVPNYAVLFFPAAPGAGIVLGRKTDGLLMAFARELDLLGLRPDVVGGMLPAAKKGAGQKVRRRADPDDLDANTCTRSKAMTSNEWGVAVIAGALVTIVMVPLAPVWAAFFAFFVFCFIMMLRAHMRENDEARLEHELDVSKKGATNWDDAMIDKHEVQGRKLRRASGQ
jgi:hypothetical protein